MTLLAKMPVAVRKNTGLAWVYIGKRALLTVKREKRLKGACASFKSVQIMFEAKEPCKYIFSIKADYIKFIEREYFQFEPIKRKEGIEVLEKEVAPKFTVVLPKLKNFGSRQEKSI